MPRKARRRGRAPSRAAARAPRPEERQAAAEPATVARRLRLALFTGSLLALSLYVPLTGMIYLESWYRLHCDWYGRCAPLGELAERSVANLTDFFLHREPLHERWSAKERRHLVEVRGIYDLLAAMSLLALAGLALGYRRDFLRRAALINIALILSLLLLLPVFGYFWRHVFHEVLFSNELWYTDRNDITWYVTPRVMFRNAIVTLVIGGVAINLVALAAGRLQRTRSARAD